MGVRKHYNCFLNILIEKNPYGNFRTVCGFLTRLVHKENMLLDLVYIHRWFPTKIWFLRLRHVLLGEILFSSYIMEENILQNIKSFCDFPAIVVLY